MNNLAFPLVQSNDLNIGKGASHVGTGTSLSEGFGEVVEVGKFWINSFQYFAGVRKIAWEFYIGCYQPARKWLKNRKGITLGFADVLHSRKIVVALTETDRLMLEIDAVEIE
jgi:hypothetical protein